MTVSHFVGSDPRCASLSSLLATETGWMDMNTINTAT